MQHTHQPIFRVIGLGYVNPVDASFSTRSADRRWNTQDFPALYCCCSERVARAVALNYFGIASVELDDLQPEYRPQLAEIGWSGERVVDVLSPAGVKAAGFPDDYPRGVTRIRTREIARQWHTDNLEGVACRSASLARLGFTMWEGPHEPWGELAIFVGNAARQPVLLRRREDLDWLLGPEQKEGGP